MMNAATSAAHVIADEDEVPTSRSADGPDFICAGVPKAGTGWLYDQLAGHPEFWMPPIKELTFLDRKFPPPPFATALKGFREHRETFLGRLKPNGRRFDERDVAFFETAASAVETATRSLDAYASFFSPKGGLFSGDVTPRYGRLKRPAITAVAERFPRAKAMALLRDPVERAWSHWRMQIERGRAASDDPQDVAKFTAFIEDRKIIACASLIPIVRKWSRAFEGRFRYFFLDDISARPEETRAEILGFLGADTEKPSSHPPAYNRKAKDAVERSPEIQAVMRAHFAEERRRCADAFGGPASAWVDAPY